MTSKEPFDDLDPKAQAEIFAESPIAEKGELLLRAHEPGKMIQKLSQEEFYLITREMDREERAELLKYASIPQLHFISDIDCWENDRMNPIKFLEWIDALRQAGDKPLVTWLLYGDYEMIIAGLKPLLQVVKADREYATDEILGDTPYFTLDESYFIALREENLLTVRRAFEVLFEAHRGRYTAILEGLLSEIDDPLEEDAYRARENRLSERGFPDFESASQIYKIITDEEFEKFPKKSVIPEPVDSLSGFESPRPNYLALFRERMTFLDEAVVRVAAEYPESAESIREEIVWVSNKVIVALGVEFTEERISYGVNRAKALISLGLDEVSGGKIDVAARFLKERWLELFFRRGVSLLYPIRDKALCLAKDIAGGNRGKVLHFLLSPYDLIIRGLWKRIPECWDPASPIETPLFKDFQSVRELERAEQALSQLSEIWKSIQCDVDWKQYQDPTSGEDLDAITMEQVVSGLFTGFVIGGKVKWRPMDHDGFKEWFKKAMHHESHGKASLQIKVRNEFLDAWLGTDRVKNLTPIWSILFDRMQSELSHLKADHVDPELLSLFYWKTPKTEKSRSHSHGPKKS